MRRTVLGVLAVAVLSACGTTVPLRSTVSSEGATLKTGVDASSAVQGQGGSAGAGTGAVTGGSGVSDGGGSPLNGTAPAPVASGLGVVSPAGPSATTRPTPTATKAVTRTGTAAPTAPAGKVAVSAKGVSASSIAIGFYYFAGSDEAYKSIGLNIDTGDQAADVKAAVAYVNSHGGAAGRKLELHTYAASGTSTASFDQQGQTICDHFVSDDRVFAVTGSMDRYTRSCLSRNGVLPVGQGTQMSDADYASELGSIDSGGTTTDISLRSTVDQLLRTDYFTAPWDTTNQKVALTGKPVVGILYPSNEEWSHAVEKTLIPYLKSKGITVDPTNVFQWTQPSSAGDDGNTVAQIQSAVLKFRSQGVTDVLPIQGGGLGFFSQGADKQGYYPRYGLNSETLAQADVTAGVIPAKTLTGALGLGYGPSADLTDATAYQGPGANTCRQAMTAAGVDNAKGSAAEVYAFIICDSIFLLQRSLNAVPAGAGVTQSSVVTATEGLGTSAQFANLPQGSFSPTKRYPASVGYPMTWDASGCTCMKYTGAAVPLS